VRRLHLAASRAAGGGEAVARAARRVQNDRRNRKGGCPMSYLKMVSVANSSGTIRRVYDAATARAGEVAEIIQVMSLDAKSAQASVNLYTNLMKTKNALTPMQRELIAVVVSNANDSYYCTMSHARDFAAETDNKKLAEQIAYDYRKAPLDPASRAL